MKFNGLYRLLYVFLAVSLASPLSSCKKETGYKIPAPPAVSKGDTTVFTNPLLPSGPDPWVYKDGDTYYHMHTTYNELRIYKTTRMSRLKQIYPTTVWTPQPGGTASANLWAPELHKFDGKWYIYYTAGHAADFGLQRLWVLENPSADPTKGTWTNRGRIYNVAEDIWAIDGTVLEQNGKRYLLWSGFMATANTQCIYICEMSNPWTLTGKRVRLSYPKYDWEKVGGEPGINEGPEILKHDGKTFLVYSASFCGTDNYALGMLTADGTANPMDTASWTKSTTPVFQYEPASRAYGTGHNGFFVSKDGSEDWIIYHANSNPNEGCVDKRNPRMQKFTWNADGTPNFGTPVAINDSIPVPSGE